MKVKIIVNRDETGNLDENVSHKKKITVDSKTKLKDFLPIIANGLPVVRNSVWAIINNNRVLEYVIIGSDESIEKEPCEDINITVDNGIIGNEIYAMYYSEKDFIYINSQNKKINLYSDCKTLFEKVKKAREKISILNCYNI